MPPFFESLKQIDPDSDHEQDDTNVFSNIPNHPAPVGRVLYISRHGESLYNLDNRIGGDPDLSSRGFKYAKALGFYMNQLDLPDLKVWHSELHRTHQTSQDIHAAKEIKSELNEIGSGEFDHLTYSEFEQLHPREFKDREENKLTYRYPNGESYIDVCKRLEPILTELNQRHNLMIITHQAVIRCILSFLLKKPKEEIPYVKVPLHTILKITYRQGSNHIEYHRLPIECVDTYRPKVDVVKAPPSEPQLIPGKSTNKSNFEKLLLDPKEEAKYFQGNTMAS